jgi:hypothetical protein
MMLGLLTSAATGCSPDTTRSTDPLFAKDVPAINSNDIPDDAIIVTNSAELVAALVTENAGRLIHMQSGTYTVSQPLSVPDHATLEGEGQMLRDDSNLPTGFAAGTETTIAMTGAATGDVLTLGNGSNVLRLRIQDATGRVGNAIGIVSREADDHLSASISEVEIVNPNAHAIVPSGPTGCGVAVLTRNLNLGADPAPHSGAEIKATISHSLIRSPATGTGCGVFAFNFAPLASVNVDLAGSVIGGGIIANGGVSRPDAVHDSRTVIQSHRNLYRDDSPNPCVSKHLGWNMAGGSGVPVPLQVAETATNTLQVRSHDDRIEGFTTAVLAGGGRRFMPSPTAGPVTDNIADLELIGTTISTQSCGGASFVSDFRLAGAIVSNASLVPGDGNTLRVVMRGVTGSGIRSNAYAAVLGPTGPLSPSFQGVGNRLEFVGNLNAFEQTNQAIDPLPAVHFFSGGH